MLSDKNSAVTAICRDTICAPITALLVYETKAHFEGRNFVEHFSNNAIPIWFKGVF
jgi:hypothetical protein